MRFWRRWTIRTRLTVLYAAAFFAAAAMLVAVMYVYLRQSLNNNPADDALSAAQNFLATQGMRSHPVIEGIVAAVSAQSEQQHQDTLRGLLVWSLIALGVIGLVAAGCGWGLAGRALRPLQNMTETARRVAGRNLHERISLDGPTDEIKELADTFDAMLERLDRAFDGQHRFVANASHELRTPLAINRTLIEVALEDPSVDDSTRRLGETLLAVNHRHERLIDGLLVLANSDQRLDRQAHVNLAELAQRAIANADNDIRRSGLRVTSSLNTGRVTGDPTLLERLITNLIENAIRYNVRDDGWVHVAVAPHAGRVRLTVVNSGPLISPADEDRLFEPFVRLGTAEKHDQSSPSMSGGAGLGLSIVRSIATAHGGAARAITRSQGGLTVEVTL